MSAHNHKVPAASAGAQCVNCHMPAKTYMRIDDRRDHSFRVPRPDLSVQLGTPNACTGCHLGRTPQWAADALTKWYGSQTAPHFATVLAAGRAGRVDALPQLIQLAETTTQPVIVRATALELLRQYGTAGARAIVAALQDANALIRAAAVGGLDSFSSQTHLQAGIPFLEDPVRAVRIEAARVLVALPSEALTAAQQQVFDTAFAEFTALQLAMADTPGAHLNLGVVAAQRGRRQAAEQAYHTALRLDPSFLPARFNLANLYNRMGRNTEAEEIFRDGLRRAPDEGELYYSLGLLLAEMKRLDEAAEALGKAAKFLPNRARVHYNYGLTLQHLERRPEAETALLTAYAIAPQDGRTLHALAIFYSQAQRWDRAAVYAEQLVKLLPNAPGPKQLLYQIQQQQQR